MSETLEVSPGATLAVGRARGGGLSRSHRPAAVQYYRAVVLTAAYERPTLLPCPRPTSPSFAWLHLPAAAWGAGIELAGGVYPLTPRENGLRRLGGAAG